MVAVVRTLLSPPEFEDKYQTHRARLLHTILLITIVGVLLNGIALVMVESQPGLAVAFTGLLILICLGLLVVLRSGMLDSISIAFLVVVFLIITSISLTYGGLRSPGLAGYLVMIALGGLLFGPRGAYGTAGVSAAAVIVLYLVTEYGTLDTVNEDMPHAIFLVIILFLILTLAAFMVMTSRVDYEENERARRHEIVLRATLAKLQETSVSKAYADNIIKSMSNLLIVIDPDGLIRSVNPATLHALGYSETDLIGQRFNEKITVDRKTDVTATILTRTRSIHNLEQQFRRKDGSSIHVLLSSALMIPSETVEPGVVVVAQDVTERKNAEMELQRRMDQMALLRVVDQELSSTLDIDLVLQMALNGAANISGADDGFIVLIDEESDNRIMHAFGGYEAVVKKPTFKLYGVARRVQRSHEPELILNVALDPDYVPDQPGTKAMMVIPMISQDRMVGLINLETREPERFTPAVFEFMRILVGRIASAADNARLYRLSQHHVDELQNLYDQVSSLEQLKTDMIRVASHDLRAPVGLIRGYISMLQLDVYPKITETEQDYIASIASAADRMDNIVSDILSLERIHQMAQNPFSEEIDLQELTVQVVEANQTRARDKNISLTFSTQPEHAAWTIRGDSNQLYEVISNLIWNAIKYTGEGGQVDVRLLLKDADDRIGLEVEDNGYGIPEEQQEKLFTPFFRARTEETMHIEGTGLGLHLVKNIVERHRGEIVFHSVYQQGSTFGFELPRA